MVQSLVNPQKNVVESTLSPQSVLGLKVSLQSHAQVLKRQMGQPELFKPGTACALLNYPDYINIGDHLIWAGTVDFITNELQMSIAYASSSARFSAKELENRVPEGPIFLLGGGNLGDLWYGHQTFRETIIDTYRHRPIVIFPQTIYFQDPNLLAQTARVFNRHPQLTIVTRDQVSFAIATHYFDNCCVLKAPDMAFQLTRLSDFSRPTPTPKILYHCRSDSELNRDFTPALLNIPDLEVKDWLAYEDNWRLGHPNAPLNQAASTAIRALWQRGLKYPQALPSRYRWERQFSPGWANHYQPTLNRRTWSFIHSGVYQFSQYRAVVTNRLHGHILCLLLGIPHVFLPNAYHKNQSFYKTWTACLPHCHFAEYPKAVAPALADLLSKTS